MKYTIPQLRLLTEGEFDTPELIKYKVHQATESARELGAWDIITMTPETSTFYGLGNEYTLTARFLDKETGSKWANSADADKATVRKWHDRFLGGKEDLGTTMLCWMFQLTFEMPE